LTIERMNRHAIPCTALLAVLAMAPLPAAAQSREQQQLLLEIQQSQAQTQQLRTEVSALAEAVKGLTTLVSSQSEANRTMKAELQTVIKNLDDEVTKLGEKVSQSSRDVARFSGELQAIRDSTNTLQQSLKDLNTRFLEFTNVMAGGQPSAPAGGNSQSGGGAPTGSSAGSSSSAPQGSPQLYFAAAMNFYTKGDYVSAVQAFQEFINKFPDNPDAGKAQLWIVQAHAQDANYKESLAAATAFIDNPKNKSAPELPDFYFYKGSAQEMLKMRTEAIATYKLIVATYPNSDAALQASNALKRLNVK
jgi:TolA-binding protein